MPELLFIKPTDPEFIVRMPERGGAIMPPHGAKVKPSPHWRKRLRDGSVVYITADEYMQAEKKAQAAAQEEARKAHEEATKAQKKTTAKSKPAAADTDK